MSRLPRVIATIAVALVATTGLSACSDQRLGSAAVVDGHRITTDRLQSLSADFAAAVPGQDSAVVQRGLLDQLISDRVYAKVSSRLGVRVPDAAVTTQLAALVTRFKGKQPLVQAIVSQQKRPEYVAPSMLRSWLRDQLLFIALAKQVNGGVTPGQDAAGNQAFLTADATIARIAQSLHVSLSPRYGTWSPDKEIDPTVSAVSPLLSGGLARTAGQLNAGS